MNTAIPKPGQRIECITMRGDPDPIPPGTVGTGTSVTPWVGGEWNIGMRWDNGRTLGLVVPEDRFTVARSS